ncbi:IS1595 family transposase, partial [Francisella tularensis subsp. holarctica]|nr:IS1595 family transposase [Francisella tularensis subsp. holarctica]
GKNHVNVIESFWSFSKRRLAKFNGLCDDKFVLHLKECEFRWNNKDNDLYKIMLTLVRKFSAKII